MQGAFLCSGLSDEAIADAPEILDIFSACRRQFAPECLDAGFHGFINGEVVITAPDIPIELHSAEYLTWVAGQEIEQIKFPPGQIQLCTGQICLPVQGINHQVLSDRQRVVAAFALVLLGRKICKGLGICRALHDIAGLLQ